MQATSSYSCSRTNSIQIGVKKTKQKGKGKETQMLVQTIGDIEGKINTWVGWEDWHQAKKWNKLGEKDADLLGIRKVLDVIREVRGRRGEERNTQTKAAKGERGIPA